MSNLRKTFNQSFDELRDSFAGLDAHSERVIYGVELVGRVQDALYSYILNAGPKPCLTFENAPHGQPESIQGHSEEQWPRVVQQQAQPTAEVHQLTAAEVPDENAPAYDFDSHARDEHLRLLADRIAGITQRKVAG